MSLSCASKDLTQSFRICSTDGPVIVIRSNITASLSHVFPGTGSPSCSRMKTYSWPSSVNGNTPFPIVTARRLPSSCCASIRSTRIVTESSTTHSLAKKIPTAWPRSLDSISTVGMGYVALVLGHSSAILIQIAYLDSNRLS